MSITYGFLILFVSSAHAVLIGEPLKCRHGWVQWRNSCFMFSSDKDSWGNAEIRCRAFGGYLAEIHDAETNTFLKNYLKAMWYDDHAHLYYIGLTDTAKTNVWEWVHSRSLPQFTDWDAGEPGISAQHCVVLDGNQSFLWHDEYCSYTHHFVCQDDLQ